MTVQEIFAAIHKELAVTPQQQVEDFPFPSGNDTGLVHPQNHGHVLCRDDQVVELGSGSAGVMVAGAGGQTSVKGTALSLQAPYIHLHGDVYFGFQRFSPWWLSSPVDPLSWTWRTAPLVQRYPGALEGVEFLTGAPQPGQVPVRLATYLQAQPLFGPNEQLLLLSRNLAELMKSVAVPDE